MTSTEAVRQEPRRSGAALLWARVRKLRTEEFLFFALFIPSMIVTIWANIDLIEEGIRSRKIRGGVLRLLIVLIVAFLLPLLHRWRCRVRNRLGRGLIEFFRTVLPFALCSAVYTNLHDTVRYINPHDIHDKLMAIEQWMFGFQPVVWAEQFITPGRTDFFSFFYANFFALTLIIPIVLWIMGRRQEARQAGLAVIVCFYSGYIFYVIFPAAPPRLYYESLEMFTINLKGGAITNFQNSLIEMMPNHASRAAFPSLHTGVSLTVLVYAWKSCRWLFPILAIYVVGLLASTVYLRHHYVVDLIAGAILVPWVIWATPRLDRWWGGANLPYDLDDR